MFSNDRRFVIWALIVGHNCFCYQTKLPNYQSKLWKCRDFMTKVQVVGRLWDECIGNNERASAGWTERYSMGVKTAAPCSGSTYEGRLISNAHSEIFCRRSKVAMRAQCVLVATTILHSGAKFHSFLYTGSKTVCVNMESCYGGMSTRLKQRAVTEREINFF